MIWKQSKGLLKDECIKYVIYAYHITVFSVWKEGHPAICDNMDEPGGHYTKEKEADTEGQRLHDTIYIMKLK